MSPSYEILFGDIHNHNSYGYGIGSLERAIDIARTHLDFFAFTGHASWHDMRPMEGSREQHWLKGFARLKEGWGAVQRLIADANQGHDFTAFLGFEWHSSRFGDQCVVFPEDHRPLHGAADIAELRRFCQAERALMIPHHLAYPQGHRGVNWEVFDEACTPVVEIFSEHGNAEHDRGPWPYVSHSMGGRETSQTVRHALARGLRFGFVASSDSHSGFPGAYEEGLMAALCRGRERASILEAVRARRTYALTGDRIEIDFAADGQPMGSTLDAGREVEVTYEVQGRDELDVVEVIQDGHVVHRSHPRSRVGPAEAYGRPLQLRFEWGWGPWGDLALDRIADWHFEITVERGRLLRAFPCLRSGPFDEQRRHRLSRSGDHRIRVASYSSRHGAYRQNPNHALVLEVEAGPETTFDLQMTSPAELTASAAAAELLEGSQPLFTGPFPKESCQWHRLVPRPASHLADGCQLDVAGRSHAYLRVRQQNGHLAWASPVFLNHG